ncbi:MAG: glycosyltransferase family 9 protein [Geobacteraceae bacterium]
MLKVRLLKQLDRYLGTTAVLLLKKPTPGAVPAPRKLLFIRPGGIGDAVLLLRAVQAVKDRYPLCRITVLAEKRNAAIFSFSSAISRVLLYDRLPDLLAAIRGGFDVVIDTEQWHRLSAVIARLTGAPLLVGFATNNRKKLFTHPIAYSHDAHESESFLALLQPLGILPLPPFDPVLNVPPQAVAAMEKKLAVLSGKPYIVLFPGASIPERRWGSGNFHELARRIHDLGFPAVVVGGRDDESAGDDIISGGLGCNFAGKTSLAETAALLVRARLLVTGDSGLLHIAAELQVPTVSLFGPGIEKKWAPRDVRHIVLNKQLDCSPCTRFGSTPKCRIGARCLASISVADVERAIGRILG